MVPYFPIVDNNLRIIVRLKLGKVAKRMLENRRTAFIYGDDVVEAIASRCTEVDSGARNIDHILTNTLLPEMSAELLAHGEQRAGEGDQGDHRRCRPIRVQHLLNHLPLRSG